MIKYIISILGLVIFVLIVFFYFRSPIFNHYLNLLVDNNTPIDLIYKNINHTSDLDGEYPFSVKHPEIFAITLGIKNVKANEVNALDRLSENLPPFLLKVQIINANKTIIFSRSISKSITKTLITQSGSLVYDLVHIPFTKCEHCILKIELLEGSLLKNIKAPVYLSMSRSGHK